DADYHISEKIKDVSCSNGLAWSPDHRTFYFIDTPTRQVEAFDYDVKDGSISNRRRIVLFNESDGYPDGMTIDSDGMLWIAFWDGWKILRLNPENGKVMFRIDLPVSNVTSCTFGGETLEDLYITSACSDLTETEL